MSELSIDPVTPEDVPLLLTMVKELAEYERLLEHVTASEADYHAALFGAGAGDGARARAFAAIARAGGHDVGYMCWYLAFSTFSARSKLHLEDLYIRPAYRGRGYGTALIADLARKTIAAGMPRMQWQVLDWNTPSIDFYRRLGADVTGMWLSCSLHGDALVAVAGR